MFDMTDEWDRYRCRYDGYTPETLEGFMAEGIATYDPDDDSYTITSTRPDGTVETWTARNTFAPDSGAGTG